MNIIIYQDKSVKNIRFFRFPDFSEKNNRRKGEKTVFMKKKIVACLLLCSVILQSLSVPAFADTYPQKTAEVYRASYMLSEGLTYTRHVGEHDTYGHQREFVLEYTPNPETRLAFVTGEYLYQTDTIRNMAAHDYPDENFIAGLNADFFNMSTGVPESAYIRDGELFTTDRDSFCLAETEEGAFFIDKPHISLALRPIAADAAGTPDAPDPEESVNGGESDGENAEPPAEIGADENDGNGNAQTAENPENTESTGEPASAVEYTVLHLNKEFSEYGLYLYNHRYAPTTKIKQENTAVTLLPYEEKMTLDTFAARLMEEENENAADFLVGYRAWKEAEPETEEANTLRSELLSRISAFEDYRCIGEDIYRIGAVSPHIGGEQKLVVIEVNPHSTAAAIPENAYVLCADNASYGYILMAFAPGDCFTLDIRGSEAFYTVTNAVGTGAVIVKDSEPIDDRTFSHYMSPQPRSAVGIKADGSLVFYAIDGRQKGYSGGATLLDLAERMAALGCVTAANFDGGGSTAVNVSLPGYDSADTVNKPSGKTERRVSNAIAFFNNKEKDGKAAAAYVYDDYLLTLSDWYIPLNSLVYADKNGYSAEPTEEQPVSLYAKDDKGVVGGDNTFYPAGHTGILEVMASPDQKSTENVAATVVSLDAPDTITLEADRTVIAPFETANLTAKAFWHNYPVLAGNRCFDWSVAAVLPTETEVDQSVDEEPIEADAEQSETVLPIPLATVEDGVITPLTSGTELLVTASRGNASTSVKITVAPYPFADMEGHWAVKDIYALAEQGVVKGELDASGVAYYLPERTFSRYEFCAMLARMTGIGADIAVPERVEPDAEASADNAESADAISDIPEEVYPEEVYPEETAEVLDFADASDVPDWAYEPLYRLYAVGILDEILHTDESGAALFDGRAPITRAEVMNVIGKICEPAPEDYVLADYIDLSEEQRADDSIRNVLSAGIFGGYEDGSLRPQGLLTRAEGAAVFMRLCGHLDGVAE